MQRADGRRINHLRQTMFTNQGDKEGLDIFGRKKQDLGNEEKVSPELELRVLALDT